MSEFDEETREKRIFVGFLSFVRIWVEAIGK